jgi:cytochrome c peroxidase
MKELRFSVLAMILLVVITTACQMDDLSSTVKPTESTLNLPTTPFNYGIVEGNDLPTLGRVLFYDPRLSINNSVSCGSCHKQALAFTDQTSLSLGFENKTTTRNSMPIQNIVAINFTGIPDPFGGSSLPTALFWDGRQNNLEAMVLEPIQNHIEMGTVDLNQLALEIAAIPDYPTLFQKAFPGQGITITPGTIGRALAAFLVSIRSTGSKFDVFLNTGAGLTDLELQGRGLFFDKYDCNSCHQLQSPINGYQLAGSGEFGGFSDIGLDPEPTDGGAFRSTNNPADKGKFKIPSLRNVALTSPYMHDGRFETLEEVMDHYSEGIKGSENLDPRLRTIDGGPKQFNIPVADQQAMVAFLNSLTDHQMIRDVKFSDPFK